MGWNALIIGLGRIGMGYDLALASEDFIYSHARALSLHSEFNLVGAVDPDQDKRTFFQKNYTAPAYGTVQCALKAHAVDLVVIASPTPTHHDLLCEILNTGHPQAILCEKPLSYDLDESRKMLSLCRERNVALYVNYIRRSEPGALEVKRRIDSAEIARPLKGVVWYSKGFLHNGSHFFDLLEYWLGESQGFRLIENGRKLSNADAEPDVCVAFEKGEAVFLATKDENFSHNAIELIASNGRLRYENGGRSIQWSPIVTDKNLSEYKFLSSTSQIIPSNFNYYQWHVINELAEALKGAQAHLCEGNQAFRVLEKMHLILKGRG